jgi:hypothetical protein
MEFDSLQCHHQYVCELVFGSNELSSNASIVHALPDEVVAKVDVLAPLMEDWIFAECQGRQAMQARWLVSLPLLLQRTLLHMKTEQQCAVS